MSDRTNLRQSRPASRPRARRWAWVALGSLGLHACVSAPKEPPRIDVPTAQMAALPAELDRWWLSFGDPTLTALIDEALAQNADVLVAAARIDQAKAALRIAKSNLYPTGNFSLNSDRTKSSLDGAFPQPPDQPRTATNHRGVFTVSYEIDLWGRLAAERSGAAARLAATTYARDSAQVAVAAQVARSYFALRAFDREVALLEETLATRVHAVDLQKQRLEAGLINSYQFALTDAERATVAATLPGLRAAREQAEFALAALLGRSPRELMEEKVARGTALAALVEAPEIPAGLPADLLLRRPDVRAAEAQLRVAAVEVVRARTRYFPSINLTGVLGGESTSLGNLLKSAANTWSVAALIAQPIFGLTQIGTEIRRTEALQQEAEITYQQAARQAYADALVALAGHRGARETLVATREQLALQSQVRDLAAEQLAAGQVSRLDLLDAERQRLGAERALVAAERERLSALVDVYQALGGGWSPAGAPTTHAPTATAAGASNE